MKLSKNHVSAIAAEDLWGRHRREVAGFVGVTKDELPRLYRAFVRVRPRDPTRFHRRLADTILEPERSTAGRELVTVLAPDGLDAW